MWCLVSFFITNAVTALARSPSFFGKDAYLTKEYINAITAYGPGLGVFTPYSYVDISYDNIPFVGKIPVLGKEGTSSKLGISPFYPPQGNPSNPFPPLYRARPLPLHVPEPQDVVAVPLDEEALHGEPLFPPELVLPFEQKGDTDEMGVKPTDPFASSGVDQETVKIFPLPFYILYFTKGNMKATLTKYLPDSVGEVIVDKVSEKSLMEDEVAAMKPSTIGRPKNPFRSKRVRRDFL
ncbi:hypothetical protein Angca_000972, partial [Angiostrongylus cantonensis]